MKEKDNYKNWDWSRMGKQTNKDSSESKTPAFYKEKARGCTDCDIVFDESVFTQQTQPTWSGIGLSNYKIHLQSGPLAPSTIVSIFSYRTRKTNWGNS